MRAYEKSHPWITFSATDVNKLGPKQWALLGEAQALCRHLADTPVQPQAAEKLYEVTLVKSALATTAIEGNTLTEAQVSEISRGTFQAPPSRQYQQREVENILNALIMIQRQVVEGQKPEITAELIGEFNRRALEGTTSNPDIVPGKTRHHSVVVGPYRGAPAEDCEYLLARLAEWLESDTFRSDDPLIQFALTITRAIYAHLYIAWIHPFADGNGRTSRLLEFMILAHSGLVPVPAAHLLSNYYNRTRPQYYEKLNQASRDEETVPFLNYAIEGLVDGLHSHAQLVLDHQLQLAWFSHARKVMEQSPPSPARDRQLALVLAMPFNEVVPKDELDGLTRKLAASYAKAGPRTLSRDLNKLSKAGLLVKRDQGWEANIEPMYLLLPLMAEQ